jgi:hypothetical protein
MIGLVVFWALCLFFGLLWPGRASQRPGQVHGEAPKNAVGFVAVLGERLRVAFGARFGDPFEDPFGAPFGAPLNDSSRPL